MPPNPLALKYSDFPNTERHYLACSEESGLFFAAPPELADWFHQKYSLEGLPPTDKRYPTIVNPHTGLRHFSRDCPIPMTLTLGLAKRSSNVINYYWDEAWAAFENLYCENLPRDWPTDLDDEESVFINVFARGTKELFTNRSYLPMTPGRSSISWNRALQSTRTFQPETTEYFSFVEIPVHTIAEDVTRYIDLLRDKPLPFDQWQRREFQRYATCADRWRTDNWQPERYQRLLKQTVQGDRFRLIANHVATKQWSLFYTAEHFFNWSYFLSAEGKR